MDNETVYSKSYNSKLLQRQLFSDFNGGLNYRASVINLRDNQLLTAQNIRYNSVDGGITVRNGIKPLGTSNSSPLYNGFPTEVTGISGATFVSNEVSGTTRYGILAVCSSASTHRIIFLYGNPHSTSQWVEAASSYSYNNVGATDKTKFARMNNKVYFVNSANALTEFELNATSAPYGTITTVPSSTGYTPPANTRHIAEYNNMIFCANNATYPQRLWFSAIGNAGLNTSWPNANFIDVGGTGDREPITGMCKCYGHLIIFKTNSIYALSGSGPSTFQLTNITNSLGIPLFNEGACVQAENEAWFLASNGPWSIGEDLKPVFRGYWVEPVMKNLINSSSLTYSSNGPNMLSYDQVGKHIYIQLYNTSPYDSKYVIDIRLTDELGQHPIVSDAYAQTLIPATPMIYFEYPVLVGIGTFTFFLSLSSAKFSVYTPNVDAYKYDGEGTISVLFAIKTKYLNLGDPISLKKLRFSTVLANCGRTTGGTISYQYFQSSDAPQVSEPTATYQSVTPNIRNVVLSPTLNKYFSIMISDTISNYTSNFSMYGIELEFISYNRRK